MNLKVLNGNALRLATQAYVNSNFVSLGGTYIGPLTCSCRTSNSDITCTSLTSNGAIRWSSLTSNSDITSTSATSSFTLNNTNHIYYGLSGGYLCNNYSIFFMCEGNNDINYIDVNFWSTCIWWTVKSSW